jgi:hypothetical protein
MSPVCADLRAGYSTAVLAERVKAYQAELTMRRLNMSSHRAASQSHPLNRSSPHSNATAPRARRTHGAPTRSADHEQQRPTASCGTSASPIDATQVHGQRTCDGSLSSGHCFHTTKQSGGTKAQNTWRRSRMKEPHVFGRRTNCRIVC